MELITLLNRCHRFRGFVYQHAHFSADKKSIEVAVRPRTGSAAVCSRCHLPAPGYDQLSERRFEFIPLWGFLVFLLSPCGASTCSSARWARRLSWKETAKAFRTSWDKVFDAVEHVVTFGLEHRVLGQIDAIGVDEIQYAKGHKYLTLVYQIDLDVTRLLWVGRERTIESFRGVFTIIGDELASKIVFVCSDMWEPYLKVIREKCSEALHILDRFHIVAKMNKALDEIRAGESRRIASEGGVPVLKKSRWLLLKREENLKTEQRFRLRDLLRYNLKTVRAYLLKEAFQQLWDYSSPAWAGKFLDDCAKTISRYSRRFCACSAVWARCRPCSSSITVMDESTISVSPCSPSSVASNSLTGLAARSPAISTPESRTNPMPVDSMARGGRRWRLARPWQNRHRAPARIRASLHTLSPTQCTR